MGGTDDPDNLVRVTIEKHALLHKQLWEDLGYERDYIAWKTLSGQMTKGEALYKAAAIANKGRPCWRANIPCPDWIRKRVSEGLRGNECRAKTYIVDNINTNKTIIIKNLRKWCDDNGHHYKSVHRSCRAGKVYKKCWKIKEIHNEQDT
jgi:hypothetical protein